MLKKIEREGRRLVGRKKDDDDGAPPAPPAPPPPPPPPECKQFILSHIPSNPTISIPVDVFANPAGFTRFLGRGSFGSVYAYTDTNINCTVAVKKIDIPTNNVRQEVSNVRKEVETNQKLKHENITHYVGCCEVNDTLFIMLEHMENGSLRGKLNEIRESQGIVENQPVLSHDLIMKYTVQIVSGLTYLHLNKVIHRDLRAANVLLSATDTAKIADFGISKELGTLSTQSGFSTAVIGNPYWRSPELIQGQTGKLGRRVDVWSLGITILEMIHVTPPFMERYEPLAYMFALCSRNEVPEIPDFVRDDIKEVLRKCLVFEVEERSHSKDLLNWS